MSLSSILDRYAMFSRPISITAVGCPSGPAPAPPGVREVQDDEAEPTPTGGTWRREWSDAWQADWASQALAIMLSKPFVQSVCWHQLADALPGSYGEMPLGGLCTSSGAPKPVLLRVAQIRNSIREGRAPAGIPNLGIF
jgi:hypothetical protein